jgi:GTP cyclohydrolase I
MEPDPMKPNTQTIERDVQMDVDTRNVAIQEVGISDLKFPLTVSGIEMEDSASQQVSATLSLAVSLARELKGIHMSRLVEDLLQSDEVFSLHTLVRLLNRLKDSQGARDATVSVEFDYYLDRQAPVSGRIGKQAYHCRWEGRLRSSRIELTQFVEVPVTTLCPCSKEISTYGAHNQRGYVEVELQHHFTVEQVPEVQISLEEMIEGVEESASAPLYPILKRVDERHVTMQAYDQPRFVEDLVRNVAVMLRDEHRMDAWKVRVTNHESIHQHNAYAVVSST